MNNSISEDKLIKYIKQEIPSEEREKIKKELENSSEDKKKADILLGELLLSDFMDTYKGEFDEEGCPPDELIVDYVNDNVSPIIKKDLDIHFLGCSTCEKSYLEQALNMKKRKMREKLWKSNLHNFLSEVFSLKDFEGVFTALGNSLKEIFIPIQWQLSPSISCSSEEAIFSKETDDYFINIKKIDLDFYIEFIARNEKYDNSAIYYTIHTNEKVLENDFLIIEGPRGHKKLICNLDNAEFVMDFKLIPFSVFLDKCNLLNLEDFAKEYAESNQEVLKKLSTLISNILEEN